MARRTKIIATIGPASDSPEVLRSLIDAGMDIARINLSHASVDVAIDRFHRIRAVAAEADRTVGILADLPGPKVRVGTMPEGGVRLIDGEEFHLVPGEHESTVETFCIHYPSLLTDVHVGDTLRFGDGAIQVLVTGEDGDRLAVRVLHGGRLTGRPGMHIPSERLTINAPTPEDFRFLDAFLEVGVDMVALSFVCSAEDVRRLGTPPNPEGPLVISKIETRAAVHDLDAIVEASGAVMVARGDLGSEFPIEELPHLQKEIIRRCIAVGRPVITATQMLESMIQAPNPTRAEASDVANAVFDGSSALMLSAETAVGVDPANVVSTMARIAERADDGFDYAGWYQTLADLGSRRQLDVHDSITNAITSGAQRAANEIGASAILCISQSGFTVRSVARYRPRAKVLGFSPEPRTINQLALSWGTTPYVLDAHGSSDDLMRSAIDVAVAHGEIASGDVVVVAAGSEWAKGRLTDTVRIITVP